MPRFRLIPESRARYIGTRPGLRGLGLTALVQDHPEKPGLILVQLDRFDIWLEQMRSGRNYQDRGWVAYKRTSWTVLPPDPIWMEEVRRRDIEAADFHGLTIHGETETHV